MAERSYPASEVRGGDKRSYPASEVNTSALPVICKYKNKIKIGVKERFKKQKNNNQHIEFW